MDLGAGFVQDLMKRFIAGHLLNCPHQYNCNPRKRMFLLHVDIKENLSDVPGQHGRAINKKGNPIKAV
jgi:hypothetical protein